MFTFGAGLGKLTEAGTASVIWGVTVRHLSRALQKRFQDLVAASQSPVRWAPLAVIATSRSPLINKTCAEEAVDSSPKILSKFVDMEDDWLEDRPLW